MSIRSLPRLLILLSILSVLAAVSNAKPTHRGGRIAPNRAHVSDGGKAVKKLRQFDIRKAAAQKKAGSVARRADDHCGQHGCPKPSKTKTKDDDSPPNTKTNDNTKPPGTKTNDASKPTDTITFFIPTFTIPVVAPTFTIPVPTVTNTHNTPAATPPEPTVTFTIPAPSIPTFGAHGPSIPGLDIPAFPNPPKPALSTPTLSIPSPPNSALSNATLSIPTIPIPDFSIPISSPPRVSASVSESTASIPVFTIPAPSVPTVTVPIATISTPSKPALPNPALANPTISLPTISLPTFGSGSNANDGIRPLGPLLGGSSSSSSSGAGSTPGGNILGGIGLEGLGIGGGNGVSSSDSSLRSGDSRVPIISVSGTVMPTATNLAVGVNPPKQMNLKRDALLGNTFSGSAGDDTVPPVTKNLQVGGIQLKSLGVVPTVSMPQTVNAVKPTRVDGSVASPSQIVDMVLAGPAEPNVGFDYLLLGRSD